MAVRISIIILIVTILLLAETLVPSAPGPEASHTSELVPPSSHAH